MESSMKAHILNLLETYHERERNIALLHYELEHPARASEAEMISAMALGHGTGNNGGHVDGHISDKTLYIALNYQSKVDKVNADTKEEIVVQLVELEQEQKRLEYYVSLLCEREAMVIRLIYFKELPLEEVASQVSVALRTVRKIRDRAIDELIEMFDYTNKLK